MTGRQWRRLTGAFLALVAGFMLLPHNVAVAKIGAFKTKVVTARTDSQALDEQSVTTGARTRARISWRLENPFRLFTDPADTRLHQKIYDALTIAELRTPVLSSERRLARKYPHGWAALMYNKTCWDAKAHSYVKCNGSGRHYITPQAHRVVLRITASQLVGGACEWRIYHRKPDNNSKPADRRVRRVALTDPPVTDQAVTDQAASARADHVKAGTTKPRKPDQKRLAFCKNATVISVPYPAGADIEVWQGGRRLARKTIRVRDIFIVGIGDSFASGEGNPDVPVRMNNDRVADYGLDMKGRIMAGYPVRQGDWLTVNDSAFRQAGAKWHAQSCHRSLYSYQLRAALQLALENPHRAVTYVGFACAGAEITTGLFLLWTGTEWAEDEPEMAQISAVSQQICGRRRARRKIYSRAYTQLGKLPNMHNLWLRKCYGPRRHIDLLFLAIGGNDVGFGRLLGNAIFDDESIVRTIGGWMGNIFEVADARLKLKTLPAKFNALNKALHYLHYIPWAQSDRIILTAYPPLAYQQDGKSFCAGTAGMELYPEFAISSEKLRDGMRFSGLLYKVMKTQAAKLGWRFADSHRAQFRFHGFCAVNPASPDRAAETLALPRMIKTDGKPVWHPFAPGSFRPYASRQRWFRTPNDAFMISNFHANGTIMRQLLSLQRLAWFQVVLAGTYGGAFHPTAEGHAAIADAVLEQARAVLAKYGQL